MILERLGAGSGRGFTIFAVRGVRDEITALDQAVRGPLVALLKDVAEKGMPTLQSQVRSLGDKLFELKPPGQRLIFMYDASHRQVIVILSIVKKQHFRMPNRDIKYAKKIRRQIEEAQREGTLTYE